MVSGSAWPTKIVPLTAVLATPVEVGKRFVLATSSTPPKVLTRIRHGEHMFAWRSDGMASPKLLQTGAWRSLVARSAGGRKVASSNLAAPTSKQAFGSG